MFLLLRNASSFCKGIEVSSASGALGSIFAFLMIFLSLWGLGESRILRALCSNDTIDLSDKPMPRIRSGFIL